MNPELLIFSRTGYDDKWFWRNEKKEIKDKNPTINFFLQYDHIFDTIDSPQIY